MNIVDLPALNGATPMGFLAALGTLRLVAEGPDSGAKLSWSEDTAVAALHGQLESIAAVVNALVQVAGTIPPGVVLPDGHPGIPRKKEGSGPDPMRVPREEFRAMFDSAMALDTASAQTWLPVLLTDLAHDRQGRAQISLFSAPSGQQSLRSMFEKPLEEGASPQRLREALTSWRRLDGFTGEYLDSHVLRSAADDPSGTSNEAGVPGATWLALMALPMLRVTGDGTHVRTTLWRSVGPRERMVWPLWREPLNIEAVRVLIEHPALLPSPDGSFDWGRLDELGVFDVLVADRRRIEGRKSAGVLALVPRRPRHTMPPWEGPASTQVLAEYP